MYNLLITILITLSKPNWNTNSETIFKQGQKRKRNPYPSSLNTNAKKAEWQSLSSLLWKESIAIKTNHILPKYDFTPLKNIISAQISSSGYFNSKEVAWIPRKSLIRNLEVQKRMAFHYNLESNIYLHFKQKNNQIVRFAGEHRKFIVFHCLLPRFYCSDTLSFSIVA